MSCDYRVLSMDSIWNSLRWTVGWRGKKRDFGDLAGYNEENKKQSRSFNDFSLWTLFIIAYRWLHKVMFTRRAIHSPDKLLVIGCSWTSEFVNSNQIRLRARQYRRSKIWILLVFHDTFLSLWKVAFISQDRSDGTLETNLYMRQAKQENFRVYTLIVENSIAAKSQQIEFVQSTSSMFTWST